MKLFALLVCLFAVAACEEYTAEKRVQDETSKKYGLNADERLLSQANAKTFFEKERIDAGGQRGQFIECRPTDSNFNGLVSCSGLVPKPNGGFAEMKRYCGYKPEIVGCSDEDK